MPKLADRLSKVPERVALPMAASAWIDGAVPLDASKAQPLRDAAAACPAPSATMLEEIPVGAQLQSGRCWMFAGLTVLRRQMKWDTDSDQESGFELSQSFLVFYEKFEKMQAFLMDVIELAGQAENDDLMKYLFRVGPARDGSDWHVFRALVLKYGVVPKRVAPDTYHHSNSRQLCAVLNRVTVEMGVELQRIVNENGRDSRAVHDALDEKLEQIRALLASFLGMPLRTVRIGDIDMTPLEYFRTHVEPFYNLEQKVGLACNPALPKGSVMTVKHGKNSACLKKFDSCSPRTMLAWINVDMDTMQTAVKRSIQELREPVWFGCDVDSAGDFDRSTGLQDLDILSCVGLSKRLSRKERIELGLAVSSHNMVFSGYGDGFFRVENSWGPDCGDSGYVTMSEAWFREHVYGVVVDKSLVDPSHWFIQESAFGQDSHPGVSLSDPRLVELDPRDLFACI
ncbi:Bleomycin hydrolase [Porphyridium purpureum]|uniref:bleomycin hydrolase n=1 Tax=Porphyridium purpureum TaxID=35688 RepID=A0A5J4Z7B7_PORPP|nr:Bleomycin hydrolase [Porphyridium purpureum]|eukprot:POR9078..scf295_1